MHYWKLQRLHWAVETKVNVIINPIGGHSYIAVQMDMDLGLCPHGPPKLADSSVTVGDMFGCDSPIRRNDGREEVTQSFWPPLPSPGQPW